MRILYGVQGTGNGHLSRARSMAAEFAALNVEVDYLFSGRHPDAYFDMQAFGSARFYKGLSFVVNNNRLNTIATVREAQVKRFWRDLKQLDLNSYDLVISDFEPLTAWQAKLSGVPSLGIGHQYAYLGQAPWPRSAWLSKQIVQQYAPCTTSIGLHWHHFGGLVLPPMIETHLQRSESISDQVLVYQPFAQLINTLSLLHTAPATHFIVYSSEVKQTVHRENVTIKPSGRESFLSDLQQCRALISSCGFELLSEAMHLGVPFLAVPVHGQAEQVANAMALQRLKLGIVAKTLNSESLQQFLQQHCASSLHPPCERRTYPNVARALARYCANGAQGDLHTLCDQLWQGELSSRELPQSSERREALKF